MANNTDPNLTQSLVIFNEIVPEYCVGDDIECRFYVDPSLDFSADKIGLYRLGWTHKQDFIAIKEVKNCSTDEFDEKSIIFNANELTDEIIKTDVEYLFCYFHRFSDQNTYQLCGRSNTFRFYKSVLSTPESERRGVSPSAPNYSDLSIHYPTLERENFNICLDPFQTTPKRLFLQTEEEITQSTPRPSRNSSEVRVRFDLPDDNSLEETSHILDDMKTKLQSAEEKISSLESQLKIKLENEDKFEDYYNELMDTIKVWEAKTVSLEEQLLSKQKENQFLEEKCSSQEIIITELKEKLESFEERSCESVEREEQRLHELFQENTLLKEKLTKVTEISEKLKQSNDRLIREKKSYHSINELYDLYQRRSETNVTIPSNEMTDDMKEFCINKTKQALEQLTDMKSIADFIVFTMDMEYGESWNCFIAQDLVHNSLLHTFGTYISFFINGLKFTIYKTCEMSDRDSCQTPFTHNSDEWPQIKIISKSKSVDIGFERLICKEVMAAIEQDFVEYNRLSKHLSRVLQTIYSINCWVICGEIDRFNGSSLYDNYFYVELEINFMKIYIVQISQ